MDKYDFVMTEIQIRIEKLKTFLLDPTCEDHERVLKIRLNEYESLYNFIKAHEKGI